MRSIWMCPLIVLAGCHSASAPEVTYEQQVKPLLDAKCATCHAQGGIGPFALDNARDVRAHAAEIKRAIEDRSMPPWPAAPGNEALRFDRSLSEDEIALVSRWVDDDAPRGDPGRSAPPLHVDMGGISRVDVSLRMPEAYSPDPEREDDYRCFVLDWPETRQRYVTGFNAEAGNPKIVHHLATFLVSPELASVFEGFDAREPEPGYSCFGGPTANGSAQVPTAFFGQWAPGFRGIDFPAGSGIAVAPGSKVVLQVHYHASGSDERDQSVLQYRVDDHVDTQGYYVPWFDLHWHSDPDSMLVPAHTEDTVHEYASRAAEHPLLALFAANVSFPEGMLVHSVLLHMHRQGTRISSFVEDAEGGRSLLLDIPRWDFDWQNEYVLQTPRRIAPDEKLGIECHWNNPTGRDLRWGEGTNDEMCASFVYVTQP